MNNKTRTFLIRADKAQADLNQDMDYDQARTLALDTIAIELAVIRSALIELVDLKREEREDGFLPG